MVSKYLIKLVNFPIVSFLLGGVGRVWCGWLFLAEEGVYGVVD